MRLKNSVQKNRLLAFFAFVFACFPIAAQATETLTVDYAGSMGAIMDRVIGPRFAKTHGVIYQGIGRGAWGLAHLLASGQMRADVFISITPGPMIMLIKKGLIKRAIPIASTRMVIAYSPKSRFTHEFQLAAHGKIPWYTVLESPGVRFGRTDPRTDPQGRNIIFTFLLAEKYYHRPDLAKKILGTYLNPRQIFTEASLLSRLQAGQIDAASGYQSAVISHHLPYIPLPSAIDLDNPESMETHGKNIYFKLKSTDGRSIILRPQPLVFYAAVLNNAAHPELARKFVAYLTSPAAQALFRQYGYSKPQGSPLPVRK